MLEAPSGQDRFRAIVEEALDALLLAGDDRRYLHANPAACTLMGRSREELLRLRVEDVSPVGTDVDDAWRRFLADGELAGEYLLLRPDGSTVEVEFRAKANVLPGQHLSILRDVTERKRAERERDRLLEHLRVAHERERRISLTLQQSMLPGTVRIEGLRVASRYIPATDAIKVGGDWYDVMDLGGGRVGVAVGDVMGHGIAAAGAMGQLRSALAAAMHATKQPGRALEILDTYARSLHEPVIATVGAAVLDLGERTVTYSSAGHPPALLHGPAPRFLDRATAPPLAATPEVEERPIAEAALPDSGLMVLYTDGLIERRGGDIDEGLQRLADATAAVEERDAEAIAGVLLRDLLDDDHDDDVALIVLML